MSGCLSPSRLVLRLMLLMLLGADVLGTFLRPQI